MYKNGRAGKAKETPTKMETSANKAVAEKWEEPKATVSYRPISLIACLGKIMEKIVADRLIFILESNHLLNDNQAGFRQDRFTSD